MCKIASQCEAMALPLTIEAPRNESGHSDIEWPIPIPNWKTHPELLDVIENMRGPSWNDVNSIVHDVRATVADRPAALNHELRQRVEDAFEDIIMYDCYHLRLNGNAPKATKNLFYWIAVADANGLNALSVVGNVFTALFAFSSGRALKENEEPANQIRLLEDLDQKYARLAKMFCHYVQAVYYLQKREYKHAKDSFWNTVDALDELDSLSKSRPLAASIQSGIEVYRAELALYSGQHDSALKIIKDAKGIFSTAFYPLTYAEALGLEARIAYQRGDYKSAVCTLEGIAAFYHKYDFDNLLASTLNFLGRVALKQGMYDNSIWYSEISLRLCETVRSIAREHDAERDYRFVLAKHITQANELRARALGSLWEIDEAKAYLDLARHSARFSLRTGKLLASELAFCDVWEAELLLRMREFDPESPVKAQDLAEGAIKKFESASSAGKGIGYAKRVIAVSRILQGDWTGGMALGCDAAFTLAQTHIATEAPLTYLNIAQALMENQQRRHAATFLKSAAASFDASRQNELAGRLSWLIKLWCILEGQPNAHFISNANDSALVMSPYSLTYRAVVDTLTSDNTDQSITWNNWAHWSREWPRCSDAFVEKIVEHDILPLIDDSATQADLLARLISALNRVESQPSQVVRLAERIAQLEKRILTQATEMLLHSDAGEDGAASDRAAQILQALSHAYPQLEDEISTTPIQHWDAFARVADQRFTVADFRALGPSEQALFIRCGAAAFERDAHNALAADDKLLHLIVANGCNVPILEHGELQVKAEKVIKHGAYPFIFTPELPVEGELAYRYE